MTIDNHASIKRLPCSASTLLLVHGLCRGAIAISRNIAPTAVVNVSVTLRSAVEYNPFANQYAMNGSVIMIRTGTLSIWSATCGFTWLVLSTYTTTAGAELSSNAPKPTPITPGRDIRS